MRVERFAPASTGLLIVSIIFANKLWILDATLMSLYWVARLPIDRPNARTSSYSPEALRRRIDRSVSDRLATVRNRRQWKIALSLAVVAALAGPFVFGSYEMRPRYYGVPLTAQERADLVVSVGRCGRDDWSYECFSARSTLARGSRLYRDDLQYFGVNAIVGALTFVGVFALAFLIPALIRGFVSLVRSYWKWLNA
jgi:hypothetical protein